ncbi:site-2 protease family protein [Tundrisphaera lichenicola]|uniref:site-2 protease family protein n=1 Tax=Tundrisphaera lichenicola TaxID=2029860 RepID=UPI003EBDB60A
MSWSWKIGRISGIPIYVHWTFLILIAYLIYGHWSSGHDLATTAEGVGFVLSIFGCVVLHELGHAMAARRYGVPTADITLLPIGGVARLQRIPEHPAEELVVAIAGPLVNVAIVGLLLMIGVRYPESSGDSEFLVKQHFLPKLLVVNTFLVLFNLLPAFPMDGGRVLRALLAMRMEYSRATRLAASVGQFMAILFGFLGLMGNPMLLLIAMFVWIGAEGEARAVQERVELRGVSVRAAMLTDYAILKPGDTLGHAADLLLAGTQQDFPVIGDGRPDGVLTRSSLFSGLSTNGREGLVGEAPLIELGRVEVAEPLGPAVIRLREGGEPCLEVVDQGRPVGLLTLENIGEYLMIRTALAEAKSVATRRPAQESSTL